MDVSDLMEAARWLETHRLEVAGSAIGAAVLVGYAMRGLRRRPDIPETHGTARWATEKEIRAAGILDQPRGVVLGCIGKHWLVDGGESHIMIISPTGGGKDQTHNFHTTIRWHGSMVIADVKADRENRYGENYQACASFRRGPQGTWPVYRFAPTIRDSASYNLLAGIRWGQPEEFSDVSVLVQSLLMPFKKQVRLSSESIHFLQWATTLLRACVLHGAHTFPQSEKTLAGVLHFMAQQAECLTALQQSPHPAVREGGLEVADIADKEQSGVWTSAKAPLDIYRNPLIAAHTTQSDFRLTDLQHGPLPMTIYLGAASPNELDYLYPLFRAFIQQAITQNMQVPTPPKWPLLFLLNEATAFGYMDVFERTIPTARSYGMRFCVPIQDLDQWFDVYGEKTSLWGNFATKVFHRPYNDRTGQRLEHMLDEQTMEYVSEQQPPGMFRRPSLSTHRTSRALLTAAQLRGLRWEDVIILHEKVPCPIMAQKAPLFALGRYADRNKHRWGQKRRREVSTL